MISVLLTFKIFEASQISESLTDSVVVGSAEISALVVHSYVRRLRLGRAMISVVRGVRASVASFPHPALSGGFLALCRLIDSKVISRPASGLVVEG